MKERRQKREINRERSKKEDNKVRKEERRKETNKIIKKKKTTEIQMKIENSTYLYQEGREYLPNITSGAL